MKNTDKHPTKQKAGTQKKQQPKQPKAEVNPQEKEQQALRQQEQDRREEEPHSSDTKDALREKTRQGLNNR